MPNLSKNTYALPLPPEAEVAAVTYDSPAHVGRFAGAIDFVVPIDTEVIAALDGTVLQVEDGHTAYGPSERYASEANWVTLRHEREEYSQYLHLAAGSLAVEAGQPVTAGQLLGRTGLSGWMTAPHLHWFVFGWDAAAKAPIGREPKLNEAARRQPHFRNRS